MSVLDQTLRRMLAPTVRSLVKEALAEQSRSGPDGHDPELFHTMVYPDPGRLQVDPTAVLNNALFNVSSGDITIGAYAFFGHNVSLLTGTHDFHTFGAERQLAVPKAGRDIVIAEGVWLSSNVIVVGPCTIGAHAVVGVASLVLHDVEPYTVVAGSPATLRSTIPRADEAAAP
jgi:acetyltransferase-like isoleucine patch superfamily enzyme